MRGTETIAESLAILNAACDLKEERLMDAQLNLLEFIKEIERIHRPERGEATCDPCRYCVTCMSMDGGSSRWPCATLRKVWKFLRPKERGEHGPKRMRATT